MANPSSKNKSLKQSLESAHETSASRANVSPYSPYQPIYGQLLPAATTNRGERLLSNYQIPSMPSLREARLVRLLHRRTDLHLHADQQWLQRYFAQWGQYLPSRWFSPCDQHALQQKARATTNRNRPDRDSNAVYEELIRGSPALKYHSQLIDGPNGLLSRGLSEETQNYGASLSRTCKFCLADFVRAIAC